MPLTPQLPLGFGGDQLRVKPVHSLIFNVSHHWVQSDLKCWHLGERYCKMHHTYIQNLASFNDLL